jgi:hypothetical protein
MIGRLGPVVLFNLLKLRCFDNPAVPTPRSEDKILLELPAGEWIPKLKVATLGFAMRCLLRQISVVTLLQ